MNCCGYKEACLAQINAENCICGMIKKHDINGAKTVFHEQFKMHSFNNIGNGHIVRSIKNHLICFTASITRMLSINDELSIILKARCNDFINEIENTTELEKLKSLGFLIIEELGDNYINETVLSENVILEKAIKYIKINYHGDMNLEITAKEVHVSKNYLSSIFVKELNCKFTNYINGLRIKKAVELMEKSNYSFSHIAALCGFKNQNYFSTVFKRLTNSTPLEYKKLHSSKIE